MTSGLLIIVTAFLLGVMGSLHCAAMCSGIAGMLHAGHRHAGHRLPGGNPGNLSQAWLAAMAYNGGRVLSYMIAGALAALLGFSLSGLMGRQLADNIMQMSAGLMMIAAGLYLSGWWNALAPFERLGLRFWRQLRPLTTRLLPITSYPGAVAAGMLWGWLPCGLVYSALVLVMVSGSPLIGAAAMGAFGLGTLPMLTAIGILSQRADDIRRPLLRQSAGAIIMVFGLLMFSGLLMGNSSHPESHSLQHQVNH